MIIKALDRPHGPMPASEELSRRTEAYLTIVREQARTILLEAAQAAQAIRQAAEIEGRRAAEQAIDRLLDESTSRKLEAPLAALRAAIDQLLDSRQAWLADWERQAVHLAAAIAERICRRELTHQPDIPLDLVREALELAGGSGRLRVLLNPHDHAALGARVQTIVGELARMVPAEVVADSSIDRGGCKVETCSGSIDQQIQTQLQRIEEELL